MEEAKGQWLVTTEIKARGGLDSPAAFSRGGAQKVQVRLSRPSPAGNDAGTDLLGCSSSASASLSLCLSVSLSLREICVGH